MHRLTYLANLRITMVEKVDKLAAPCQPRICLVKDRKSMRRERHTSSSSECIPLSSLRLYFPADGYLIHLREICCGSGCQQAHLRPCMLAYYVVSSSWSKATLASLTPLNITVLSIIHCKMYYVDSEKGQARTSTKESVLLGQSTASDLTTIKYIY